MITQVGGGCPVCGNECIAAQTVDDGHRYDFSDGVKMCFVEHTRTIRDGPLVMYIHPSEDNND